jgi:GMP synthase PP-ATPase subunit
MDEPLSIPDSMELKLLNAHSEWLENETRKIGTLVQLHEQEMVVQCFVTLGLCISLAILMYQVNHLRRELDNAR